MIMNRERGKEGGEEEGEEEGEGIESNTLHQPLTWNSYYYY